MSAWKTMESAPKDGTWVLLYGAWSGEIAGHNNGKVITVGYWSNGKSDYVGDQWWDIAVTDGYAAWIEPEAWQPLPAPPLPGESNARFIAGPATPSKR